MSHKKHAQSKKQESKVAATAVPREVEPCTDPDITKNEKRKMTPYEKSNLCLTTLGIVVGIDVAIIYGLPLSEMQHSVDLSREHFEMDQGPYVGQVRAPQNTPVTMGPVFNPAPRSAFISWN